MSAYCYSPSLQLPPTLQQLSKLAEEEGGKSSAAAAAVAMQRQQLPHFRAIKALFWCLLLLSLPACVPQCGAEYFSSVDSLQRLGDIELSLVEAFRQYFDMQQKEFANYRKFIEHVRAQHDLVSDEADDYLGNPINAFTLIKRMVMDWNQLHESIAKSEARNAFRLAIEDFNKEARIPDENELQGAIQGLARLQKVYNLSAFALADGEINGEPYGAVLNWQECFEIATSLFEQKELPLAVSWFEVALTLLSNENDSESIEKYEVDTMEYLALAHYDLGHTDVALAYLDTILQIEPEHSVKDTKIYMQRSVPKQPQLAVSGFYANYTNLCRGIRAPVKQEQWLTCSLTTQGNPVFRLAPLKKEDINLDPEISLFHGLLTDVQINDIRKEAEALMTRSAVRNGTEVYVTSKRISQTAWLPYASPVMQQVKYLVANIDGMDLNNAEPMQVVNYGIGGQYDVHHDFLTPTSMQPNTLGDRISTNMFYLSDVEQGGYTVFPRLNLYVRPVKGTLVRWYNLHRSLDEDYRTVHGGCPVLKGSKRIGNVWIHSGFQEFARPCTLERDHSRSLDYRV